MREQSDTVNGSFIDDDGSTWFRIENHDLLDPFLVSLVTPDDQWAFISSSGALTAGRGSAEKSLLPYETDDRLHRSGGRAGPLTIIRAAGRPEVWQPFDPDTPIGRTKRTLAKTAVGDRLRFTEHHPGWGLTFEYTWATAGRFGLVRSCRLALEPDRDPLEVTVLDGLVNVLPAGVELATQQASSTLVDAYRRTELEGSGSSHLALFTLEALISDKADPAEALTANVIWSCGPDLTATQADGTHDLLLSERQVRRFRSGHDVTPERLTTGTKGAHLQTWTTTIDVGRELRWVQVADVALDHRAVVDLIRFLDDDDDDPSSVVTAEIEQARQRLIELVAAADGLQITADRRSTVHHLANVLFNCMRGGVFPDDHRVAVESVADFVAKRDRRRHARYVELTERLDPEVEIDTLRQAVSADDDIRRLVNEYLPLAFSRRHGDPSRPWNSFRIGEPGPSGRPAIGYQGNWRDIFQNWEALLHSFPLYIESVISKFLSASTLDGHNPYRITDEGIDWELPEDGSWGNYGYWGDHQIVYLHRLLDTADRFHPDLLESRLAAKAFSYADVPYRLRPYDDLVRDPKRTLDFDHERQAEIDDRVSAIGADGRLVPAEDGSGVLLATLAEKLLVPALAKLSNLVAGGGIWLNTQRPEWNDANNALVGNGVSVVTVMHLRDYLGFLDGLLAKTSGEVVMAGRVLTWLREVADAFTTHDSLVDLGPDSINDPTVARDRRHLLNALGVAYERYRTAAYAAGPGDPEPLAVDDLRRLIEAATPHVEAAVRLAERSDGLVHTYWLMRLTDDAAYLDPLYEMLEGQVAAMSSPTAAPDQVSTTMSALFDGELHRADQGSFVLYPDRRPPSFLEKNRMPAHVSNSALSALADGDSGLVEQDANGDLRFASHLRSARVLESELDGLAVSGALGVAVASARADILAAYEAVFDHRSFTGRSQSMYGYEGLGSIYWHMVSKLLFALQERVLAAVDSGESPTVVDELFRFYGRVRDGLGYRKTVAKQGTFPTDPHSHTPLGMGAQQPGMTGQVKEGVLIRWAELGVRVRDGRLGFDPVLLDPGEFLTSPARWDALGPDGLLQPGSLGLTYCGVPVVYSLGTESNVVVSRAEGDLVRFETELDRDTSTAVFGRTGLVTRIDVTVNRARLLAFRVPDALNQSGNRSVNHSVIQSG